MNIFVVILIRRFVSLVLLVALDHRPRVIRLYIGKSKWYKPTYQNGNIVFRLHFNCIWDVINWIIIYLPVHWISMHIRYSELSPKENSPPYNGLGLLHVRPLCWSPIPHEEVQVPQSSQTLHPPLTRISKLIVIQC